DLENKSQNSFVAKVEDKAGNVGASSPAQTLGVELVVNVNKLSTTDHTPIVSGSTGFDIRHGETVEVTINGHKYSSSTGEVVIDFRNNTWYVQIPDNLALATGVYDVSAVLKNKNGDQVTQDATHDELTIDPTPTVKVGAGGSDPNQKATGVTVDQNGQFMIFSNQAIMSQSGHDNGSVGDFIINHVTSQEGGSGGDKKNNVQTGTWMDYDRDGYMDFFGSDSTFSNGQQAFLNDKGNGWIPYNVGQVKGTAEAVTPANPDGLINPNANVYVWFGGVVAFDKLGTGYTSIAYGDQTSYDPYVKGGLDSFIVLNTDGTMAGMMKDWNYTFTTTNKDNTSPYESTNDGNANAGMEMSGVDLNNDGTVDLVFHAEGAYSSKIGGPGTSLASTTNPYKLVVAQNMGDGTWYSPQILTDFFQRATVDEGDASGGAANGISMTWADFNGDGYMDLFVGRGRKMTDHSEYESRILFNDGKGHLNSTAPDNIGTATNMYFMGDNLAGGASIAVDWNHDGKMDIIETPGMKGNSTSIGLKDQKAPVNLYTNTSKNGVTSFETSTLIDQTGYMVDKDGNPITKSGQTTTIDKAAVDPITGAVSIDVDYDGAKDLLVFSQNGHTQFVRNENVVEYGTSLHFRILDQDGINSLFGNNVRLYDSHGNLVATQIINPQSGNQTNDSTAIVDFYGLDKNETYSLAILRNVNGKVENVGGLATLGTDTIQHVNSSWTGLKAAEANHAYVLTANGDETTSNATRGPGIVGTGYNDTFIAAKGSQYYEGGGGTVVVSGEKSWSNTGGEDIVDYYNSTVAINVDLSITGAQNTGYNTAKFSNIEGIYGTSLNDTFKDGAGDNIFNGRGGDDTFFLTQGKTGGKDTLLYELIDNNDATGGNGHDTVYGFTVGTWEATPGADRIDIRGLLVGYKADADGPAHYIDGVPTIDAGDNIGQYLSAKTEGGNTVLYMDRDGAGGAFNSEAFLTLVKTDVTLEELLANHQIVV
ncbi:MAG: VCBS repeat-containing protein, partial [Bartonella sp.]|nr:VCBS repeat-containing protein [Bartonella sp.]